MYAIIDIGSNTIRLNVYQVEEDGAIHSIFQSKETAGLAGYVREDGSMSREGLDRAADALLRFRSILDALHIENRRSSPPPLCATLPTARRRSSSSRSAPD